jgi:hypothetical protein
VFNNLASPFGKKVISKLKLGRTGISIQVSASLNSANNFKHMGMGIKVVIKWVHYVNL